MRFEFGVTDDDAGHSIGSRRAARVARGMPWSSVGKKQPKGWDAAGQLRRVEGER